VLTLPPPRDGQFRDSASVRRRSFLRVGALTLGGLTLENVLRLRASAAPGERRQKSAIMIHLSGGPSHLDMYDMKPHAPREYRGEFQTIRTNVPGMEVCELMPMQAKIADKFAILRGVQLIYPLHTGNEFYSGYPWQESPRVSVPGEAQRPAVGSIVSRLRRGAADVPPYVSIENHPLWERAYYAGVEHEPVRVGGGSPREPLDNMRPQRDVSARRLESRAHLLAALDTLRRDLDANPVAAGMDAFRARALEMITSSRVRDALDLDKVPPAVRARYGEGPFRHGPHPGRSLLMARRLVEAGVSVVTVGVHNWDTHRENFATLRELVPPLDQALHALVTDLEQRGLLSDVAVVMGGEFGRTPRVGDQTPDGRGHWPEAGFLWVAGGGFKTGQVLGATDPRGERAIGNPIRMQNVLATLYHLLGIDPSTTLRDHNGRPQYVLDNHEVVPGLL
jgi:hypothetical protein